MEMRFLSVAVFDAGLLHGSISALGIECFEVIYASKIDGETIIKQDGEVKETPINENSKDAPRDKFIKGQGYKVLYIKICSIRETFYCTPCYESFFQVTDAGITMQ